MNPVLCSKQRRVLHKNQPSDDLIPTVGGFIVLSQRKSNIHPSLVSVFQHLICCSDPAKSQWCNPNRKTGTEREKSNEPVLELVWREMPELVCEATDMELLAAF